MSVGCLSNSQNEDVPVLIEYMIMTSSMESVLSMVEHSSERAVE